MIYITSASQVVMGFWKAYEDRADDIIGERTPAEKLYDDEVLRGLELPKRMTNSGCSTSH